MVEGRGSVLKLGVKGFWDQITMHLSVSVHSFCRSLLLFFIWMEPVLYQIWVQRIPSMHSTFTASSRQHRGMTAFGCSLLRWPVIVLLTGTMEAWSGRQAGGAGWNSF